MTERYEALERALAVVMRPGGWTQQAFCRRRADDTIFTDSEAGFYDLAGNAYCALGAVELACGGDIDLQAVCATSLDAVAARRFGVDMEEVNDGHTGEGGRVGKDTARRRVHTVFQDAIREAKTDAAVALGDLGEVARCPL